MTTIGHSLFYKTRRYIEIVILIALGTYYAFGCYQRNLVWKTGFTLWTDCAVKSPLKARPHFNLGSSHAIEESYDKAIAHLSEAIRIMPDYAKAHSNLGGCYYDKGLVDKAIFHLQQAIKIAPRHPKAHYILALAYGYKGKYNLAYEEMRLAKKLGLLPKK